MVSRTNGNFIIKQGQSSEKGTPWRVLVYKKVLGFKKQVSSDWFLDEAQAKKFADQLERDLQTTGQPPDSLKDRQPGWTLRRPTH